MTVLTPSASTLPAIVDRPLVRWLAPLALGLASALSFEPVGWWPLMPLAFAALAALIADAPSLRRALLAGWLFGFGQFVLGLNWIATAFTFQAAMPTWLGWVAVVLLSLYLAVYPALAAGLAWRFGRRSPAALVLALAGGWALTEYLRATLFTGFAWNPIGVVLVDTWWREGSAVVGTYGLSALVVLAGGALWALLRRSFLAARIAAFLLILPLWPLGPNQHEMTYALGRGPMNNPGDPAPPQPPLAETLRQLETQRIWYDARIVQPNIGQEDKWRPGFADEAAEKLARLSAFGRERRVTFWPEAAVVDALYDQRRDPRAQALAAFERRRATAGLEPGNILVTGGIALFSKDGRRLSGAGNSIFILGPEGRLYARYDKSHLVPYGEYLPMRPLLSAIGLSRLAPGDLDFTPGPGPRTLFIPGFGKAGMQVCYEIIFSGQVVDRANRPDFLFNPSNDAWFGRWGPPQHLAQARLRAAEEGLPVIRATPTGISALVDASGAVMKSIGWQQAGVIDAAIPLARPKPTPFARHSNLIPLTLAFLLLILAVGMDARGRYRRGI